MVESKLKEYTGACFKTESSSTTASIFQHLYHRIDRDVFHFLFSSMTSASYQKHRPKNSHRARAIVCVLAKSWRANWDVATSTSTPHESFRLQAGCNPPSHSCVSCPYQYCHAYEPSVQEKSVVPTHGSSTARGIAWVLRH